MISDMESITYNISPWYQACMKMGFCIIKNPSTFYLNDLDTNCKILLPYKFHAVQ